MAGRGGVERRRLDPVGRDSAMPIGVADQSPDYSGEANPIRAREEVALRQGSLALPVF
jgi:hypothetical protein